MRKRGFTLIELLIVVAIIAILALIAVPNFLEAQVRSKVSRAKEDLRTQATAFEAYAVDYTMHPPNTSSSPASPWYDPRGSGLVGRWVTTPVAYLSSFLTDPFVQMNADVEMDEWWYSYHNIILLGWSQPFIDYYGAWRTCSNGPDRDYWNTMPGESLGNPQRVYDPSNGTISFGNVWRSQNHPDCDRTPVGWDY